MVGVLGPWNGGRQIEISPFNHQDFIATRHGVQLRLENIPLAREQPYYAFPIRGNQLKSYGGFFKYEIEYEGTGAPVNSPDIILIVSYSSLQM